MAPIPILYPSLRARQSDGSASCNCMSGGDIAGIVIGSIAGTLLILWLIYTVRQSQEAPVRKESSVGQERRRRRRRRGSVRETRAYVRDDGQAYRVRAPSKVYSVRD